MKGQPLLAATGAVLLVGGWCSVDYAKEQRRVADDKTASAAELWLSGEWADGKVRPSSQVFILGGAAMALGAGLLVFAWSGTSTPRIEERPSL